MVDHALTVAEVHAGGMSVYVRDNMLVRLPGRSDTKVHTDCMYTSQNGVWIISVVSELLMSRR